MVRKLSKEQEVYIVQQKGVLTNIELAEICDVAPSTVRSIWQKYGVTEKPISWQDIKPYLDAGWTRSKIKKHLKTSKRTIKRLIKENDYIEPQYIMDGYIPYLLNFMSIEDVMYVTQRGECFVSRKNKRKSTHTEANHNYFQNIDTQQAYWIGFLLADGCTYYRNNTKTLSIGLQLADRELIDEFQRNLSGGHIYLYNRKSEVTNNTHCYIAYTLNSNQVCSDIEQFGIVPRKSKNLRLPKIMDDRLFGDMLRGIIDGDGSIIGCGKFQSNYTISISGQYTFLRDIQLELDSRGVNSYYSDDKRGDSYGNLTIRSKSDKYKLIKLIYPTFEEFGLKRKKAKLKALNYIIKNADWL